MKKTKILVVGQTPPPFGGQAIMIENMLRAEFKQVQLIHTRMSFSSDMDEIGKFKLNKIIKLFQLIFSIFYLRVRHNIKVLYYPPAPPKKVPMVRDILILNSTRWLFSTVIFHFHAAGISEMYQELSGPLKKLYEKAFFYPDVCIRLSEFNPEDGKFFRTKKEFIVPNGLKDLAAAGFSVGKVQKGLVPLILNVGMLSETKGVMVLLESAKILAQKGLAYKVCFMGRFESEAFRDRVLSFIEQNKLEEHIEFLGVQTGEQKTSSFAQADIFCFPTFFEAETFGLVAVEAMQFSLPVVASRWRGVSSVVDHETSGFLAPPKDAVAFAEYLEVLILDPDLRKRMGEAGRKIYEEKFTAEKHFLELEKAFTLV